MAGLEKLTLPDSWRLPPEDGRFGSVNTHNPDSKPQQPTVKAGMAAGTLPVGTIARNDKGEAVYVLQSDGHWKTCDEPQSDAAATKVTDLPEYEYHIKADGWHLLSRDELRRAERLDAAYKPMADASRNAGHEEPIDKHVVDGFDMDKDGPSVPASAATQAPITKALAAQAGPAESTSAPSQGLKPSELPPADQKTLKEWAAKIDKSPWLAQNPAEKEFAKTVNKAVVTGDWSEVAGLHPNMPAFRKTVEAWHNHANAEHARVVARSKTHTWEQAKQTYLRAISQLSVLKHQDPPASADEIRGAEWNVESLRQEVDDAWKVVTVVVAHTRAAEAKAGLVQADLF